MKAWWKHDRTIVECWNITGSSKYIIRSVSIEYENRKSKVKSGVTMIFFLQQVRNWARQERKKNLPVSDLDTGTNWEWKHLNFVPNWEKTAETSTRKRAGKCTTWSKKSSWNVHIRIFIQRTAVWSFPLFLSILVPIYLDTFL